MSGLELDTDGTDSYHPEHPWEQTTHPLYLGHSDRTRLNWPPVAATPHGPAEEARWRALPDPRDGQETPHSELKTMSPDEHLEEAQRLMGLADSANSAAAATVALVHVTLATRRDPDWLAAHDAEVAAAAAKAAAIAIMAGVPHDSQCASRIGVKFHAPWPCNCWKARAEAEGSNRG